MKSGFISTTCPYCGCGCGLVLQVLEQKVIGTLPVKTHPVSQGSLCIKGWNAHEFIHSNRRLLAPLVKKNGGFVPVSWEEALDTAASLLKECIWRYGPEAVQVLASAKITNEENFLLNKFARAVIGTNNLDHCARLCHASTVVGLAAAFGSGAMTNSIVDLVNARTILIIGSNTSEAHPIAAKWIFRALEQGARLLVAEPRRIQLAELAEVAVQQLPGTDVALINGMMHLILREGWHDRKFIEERTEGFEELAKLLGDYPPERVAAITRVAPEKLYLLAKIYATHKPSAIVYSMGITQHTTGVDNVKSLANLAMLTGNVGFPGSGVNALRGQNNVQGACDMGALPNVFSGYQAVTDEAAQAKFSQAWGRELPKTPGYTVTLVPEAIESGKLKALYIVGENPLLSDPDLGHVRRAFEKLEVLIVQDIFLSQTARLASVVLPGASFAEKEGTFTNTERRVLRVRQAIPPVGQARADWQIIQELAQRLGYPMEYRSPQEIFEEIRRLTPSYAGMTYERLNGAGLQWPCPTEDHPGTPYLHKDRFTRGKGLFHAVPFKPPAEQPDKDYPLILSTGRSFAHFHTGTMTRVSPTLHQEVPTGYVEINPADADRLHLEDGEAVKVTSRRGSIRIPVRVSERVDQGVVFIPFHFAECAANLLTNPALDPVAKIPEFKVCAVKVEKLPLEAQS
uniref:nitrate reductase (cytochrome) n=1 Tax=Desulfobacca acetoxidans TaxID=60893 RepID=A0A7C5ENR8_9BACT